MSRGRRSVLAFFLFKVRHCSNARAAEHKKQTDCFVDSVPSKAHNCAAQPDHLRSEISFSCTCSIPNLISCFLISCLYCLKRFTSCDCTWLRHCIRTKTKICSAQNFLRGNTVCRILQNRRRRCSCGVCLEIFDCFNVILRLGTNPVTSQFIDWRTPRCLGDESVSRAKRFAVRKCQLRSVRLVQSSSIRFKVHRCGPTATTFLSFCIFLLSTAVLRKVKRRPVLWAKIRARISPHGQELLDPSKVSSGFVVQRQQTYLKRSSVTSAGPKQIELF